MVLLRDLVVVGLPTVWDGHVLTELDHGPLAVADPVAADEYRCALIDVQFSGEGGVCERGGHLVSAVTHHPSGPFGEVPRRSLLDPLRPEQVGGDIGQLAVEPTGRAGYRRVAAVGDPVTPDDRRPRVDAEGFGHVPGGVDQLGCQYLCVLTGRVDLAPPADGDHAVGRRVPQVLSSHDSATT